MSNSSLLEKLEITDPKEQKLRFWSFISSKGKIFDVARYKGISKEFSTKGQEPIQNTKWRFIYEKQKVFKIFPKTFFTLFMIGGFITKCYLNEKRDRRRREIDNKIYSDNRKSFEHGKEIGIDNTIYNIKGHSTICNETIKKFIPLLEEYERKERSKKNQENSKNLGGLLMEINNRIESL